MTLSAVEIKDHLRSVIERDSEKYQGIGDDIFAHPELAYREQRTSSLVADELRGLGLSVDEGLAVTGVKARLEGSDTGPSVAILGELDALLVPEHPSSDSDSGAAHACGHNAQIAHLLAVANALVETDAMSHLSGSVTLLAVPAEEFPDLEWALEQKRKDRFVFFGGKQELLRLGHLDDVDMAMLIHASGNLGDQPFSLNHSNNGLVAKQARFIGKASHAASRPHRGVNALYAASLAIAGVNAQRETFQDAHHVRVHPVLRMPQSAVNVIPSEALIDSFVRGSTIEAIEDAGVKFDRAMRAGALALGAELQLRTLPGYMPMITNQSMAAIFRDNARAITGNAKWTEREHISASTDAGDLSQVMPVVQPSHGGCSGTGHSAAFKITDPYAAYTQPAIGLAWTVVDLLCDGGKQASEVLDDYQPQFTKELYLEKMAQIDRFEVFHEEAAG